MKVTDLFQIALRSIVRNKTRSLLTMLGVIIGVGAVIGIIAIGKGSDASIRSEFGKLGTNMLVILPGSENAQGARSGAGTGTGLKERDAHELMRYTRHLASISPVVTTRARVIHGSDNWLTNVSGVYNAFFGIQNYEVQYGQKFNAETGRSLEKVCVIGRTVADELFREPAEAIGQNIRLNKIPFLVIGVLEAKGQGSFGNDQDDLILAPFRSVQKRMIGIDYINYMVASATSDDHVLAAKDEVHDVMLNKLNKVSAGEPAFTIRTLKELTNVFGSITGILTILLAVIASISLLVGGIGIMNIMLVSVTERTREIGLRRAIGAPRSAILMQFLWEAVLISLTGGVFGIFLGAGLGQLAAEIMNWPLIIPGSSILLAFGFAFLVGVLFGYFPARKASRLNPIEALRYE